MSWLDAAPELLEVARRTLREEVMPAVAKERRYEAAMVASAIGIAARATRDGATSREQERAEFASFLGQPDAALPELRRALCRAIRAGALLPEVEKPLREMLLADVRRRLAVSNPDHLTRSNA